MNRYRRLAPILVLPVVTTLAIGCYQYVPTPPTSVHGTVTDRDGRPLSNARVTLDTAHAETDGEGRFDVSCDPERECDFFPRLLASADGHATVFHEPTGSLRTELHVALPVDDGVPEAVSGIPRRHPLPLLRETKIIDERRSEPEALSPMCTTETRDSWRPDVFACRSIEGQLLWPCVDDESHDDPAQVLCARFSPPPRNRVRLAPYQVGEPPPVPLVPVKSGYRVRHDDSLPPLWVTLDDGTFCDSFDRRPTTTASGEPVLLRCSAFSDTSSRAVETVLIGDVTPGSIATIVQGGIDTESADGRVRVLGRRLAEISTLRR